MGSPQEAGFGARPGRGAGSLAAERRADRESIGEVAGSRRQAVRGWLIDTNVVSELRRARPSPRVRAFVAGQPGDVLFTNNVTFAKVRFGIERITDAVRRADLVHWLDRTLRPLFAGRVLPVTEDALLRWRLMLEAGRAAGHTSSEPDLLVAALASLADHIVVSRDTSEFAAAGGARVRPVGLDPSCRRSGPEGCRRGRIGCLGQGECAHVDLSGRSGSRAWVLAWRGPRPGCPNQGSAGRMGNVQSRLQPRPHPGLRPVTRDSTPGTNGCTATSAKPASCR